VWQEQTFAPDFARKDEGFPKSLSRVYPAFVILGKGKDLMNVLFDLPEIPRISSG
jgi:hypothetical protein